MTVVSNKQPNQPEAWHQLTSQQAVTRLASDGEHGLTTAEASKRLTQHGPNQLVERERKTWVKILLAQLNSSLVVLLLAAALISFFLREESDAVAILAIILLNTLLGFWQDFQAEKSLAALKKLAVPEVTVWRDGTTLNISAALVVPGDVLVLQAGYFVPADCRLLEINELAIDESALTGESLAVEKSSDAMDDAQLSLGDQLNIACMGTMVVRGRGRAVVTATGMSTELGKIAGSLQKVKHEPTPLQVKLGRLSRTLAMVAVAIVCFVFLAGIAGGQSVQLMLRTALSMAVAIVPEGLPAVATVALAIGARRMFNQNALIRQLPAVETLGSVSVICSDKTGTLTQNRMTATILEVANARLLLNENEPTPETVDESWRLLLLGSCLCNDALLHESDPAKPVAVGEPTETALVEIAARMGLDQLELQRLLPRTSELPFESERQRMSTVHAVTDGALTMNLFPDSIWDDELAFADAPKQIVFVKGSVDSLLQISSFVWVDHRRAPLDDAWRQRIVTSQDELADRGTRVLAIGFRPTNRQLPLDELEQGITFVGLIGLTDPPRPEAKTAVALCRQAGIRPIMITGDHPLTAMSIARQLGISDGGEAMNGQELSRLTVDELRERVRDVAVFARVAPADKLHIVEALQRNREVVAMTGDGVNDAPALKQANVGVAMGLTGTDVSKQAANVVLLDDNFATIVAAVEQGRIVYDNVRKFVKYTMSSNVGEIFVMTIGVLLGMLPLLPLQILWINLVTDGLPGLALAVEPVEKNTMRRPPLSLDEPIFNRRMKLDLLWIGSLIGIVSLGTGSFFWAGEAKVDHWRTVVFTVLTLAQMANAFACRSESRIWFFYKRNTTPEGGEAGSKVDARRGPKSNPWMWYAVTATFLLQMLVVYWTPLQNIFHTQSLTLFELSVCLAASLFVFAVIEIQKTFGRTV